MQWGGSPWTSLGRQGINKPPSQLLPSQPCRYSCTAPSSFSCTLKQFLTRTLVRCVRCRADRMCNTHADVQLVSSLPALRCLHCDRVRPQVTTAVSLLLAAITAITQLWPQQQEPTHSVQRYYGHNLALRINGWTCQAAAVAVVFSMSNLNIRV